MKPEQPDPVVSNHVPYKKIDLKFNYISHQYKEPLQHK